MKRYLLPLILLLALSSCNRNEETIRHRVILNESSYAVVFEVHASTYKDFKLSPGSSLSIGGTCTDEPGISYCTVGWDERETVWGRIVFNGERVQTFPSTHCTGTKNILAALSGDYYACGYTDRRQRDRTEQVYTITDEDYEQAEEL